MLRPLVLVLLVVLVFVVLVTAVGLIVHSSQAELDDHRPAYGLIFDPDDLRLAHGPRIDPNGHRLS